jgi:hypothetical protein
MTNLTGVCWWSGHVLGRNVSNVVDRLAPHYAQKTLVPLYRDRTRVPPAPVVDVRADLHDDCITLTWRHPVPDGGHSKAAFTAVFRGAATHPEIVTDKTSATLKNPVGETFRIVALDRLQNASPPAIFCCRKQSRTQTRKEEE